VSINAGKSIQNFALPAFVKRKRIQTLTPMKMAVTPRSAPSRPWESVPESLRLTV